MNMSWNKKQRYKSPYINKDIHVFQMKTAHIERIANRQSHRCYVGIPMDISNIMNVTFVQCNIFYASIIMDISTILYVVTTQHRRCYAGIPMDIFAILYVVTTQRRRGHAGIPMNTSITTNVLISQLGTSCAFDSPGLARNEPTSGKRSQGDSTP